MGRRGGIPQKRIRKQGENNQIKTNKRNTHCRKVFFTMDRGTSTLQEGVLYCAQGDKRTQLECAFIVERVSNAHCKRVLDRGRVHTAGRGSLIKGKR